MDEATKIQMEELKNEIKDLRDVIKPIAESYQAAVKLGTWATKLVVFISVAIGIIIGYKNLFK